jgi:purine-nucleoside phosphorylase
MAALIDASIRPAVDYLKVRLPFSPHVILVLGSGLDPAMHEDAAQVFFPYSEIPGFPLCGIPGHAGRLALMTWQSMPVAALEGRAHRYEGYSLETVTRPIRTLIALGARLLITTCAAGALYDAPPGTLFLIDDHLNLMGESPVGCGTFVEMADAYDSKLKEIVLTAARRVGLTMERGVLACVPGPQYETAAEAEMLRRLGAHAVNMSVVPEVIAARSMHVPVVGIAVLTNKAGRAAEPSAHQHVLAVAERSAKSLGSLLHEMLALLGPQQASPFSS